MFGYRSVILMGAALSAIAFQAATAQEWFQRDRNTAVMDRAQPEFDPEPIRLGAIEARPSLGLGGYYIDNVFATADDEAGDFAFTIRPDLDLRTTWSRHEVGFRAGAEHFEFIDEGSESVTNLRAEVRGRLDVNREWSVSSRGFVREQNEPRTQISILDNFGEPVEFFQYGGGADVNYGRDRILFNAGYEFADSDFDDVEASDPAFGDVDQDFRDNQRHTFRSRLTYAVTRDWAVFAQGSYFIRDFDTETELDPGVFANRDSDGFTVEGGVNFELNGPFRGDVAVGYLSEDRESPLFADIDGFSVNGRLQWFPTQLTTVTARAGRRTSDVGLIDAAAATSTNGNLRIDHELLRNVILYADGGIFNTDFEDFDRDDTFFNVGIGSIYKINKRVHVEGFYRYTNRDSTFAPEEFSQNIVGFEIRLFP